MATLQDGDLVLDVRVGEVNDVVEIYHVGVLRRGRPIVDPTLIKGAGLTEWRSVPAGFFRVTTERHESLEAALDAWVAARQPAAWSPAERDIVLSLSTDVGFPYHQRRKPPAEPAAAVDPDGMPELDLMVASQYGPLGKGAVELLVGIDGNQLEGGEGYTGPAILFRFVVSWDVLATFAKELRAEI